MMMIKESVTAVQMPVLTQKKMDLRGLFCYYRVLFRLFYIVTIIDSFKNIHKPG